MLLDSVKVGIYIYLSVFGPVTLQIVALYYAMRGTSTRVIRTLGWKALLLISWIGTPIHELGHAVAVVALGGKVKRLQLFKPDPHTGQLGEVQYSFKKKAPVREAVVALAPLITGTGALMLVTWLLMPDAAIMPEGLTIEFSQKGVAQIPLDLALSLWDNFLRLARLLTDAAVLSRWQTWLWIYLVICIGTRLAPSAVDFKKTWWVLFAGLPLCWLVALALLLYRRRTALYEKPFVFSWAESHIGKPLIAINSALSLTLLLCLLAAVIILLVTIPFTRKSS